VLKTISASLGKKMGFGALHIRVCANGDTFVR